MTTDLTRPGAFDDAKIALIKRTIATNATNDELALFVQVCERTGLDPFARQIYCIHRGGKMGIQTSIDGLRLIAERTKHYAGQLGPFWTGDGKTWVDVWLEKTPPRACKVGILRSDFKEPMWSVGTWDFYAQSSPMWQKGGAHMLAKCVEALGLRRAFPQELSGLYEETEMGQADAATYTPPPPVRESDARIAGTHGKETPWNQKTNSEQTSAQDAEPATTRNAHVEMTPTPTSTSDRNGTTSIQTAKPRTADLDADWREAPVTWKPGRAGTAAAVAPSGGPITPDQTKAIHTLLSRVGNITDEAYRKQVMVYRQADGSPCAIDGKGTSKLLSKEQASHLISRLEAKCDRQEQRAGSGVDLDAVVPAKGMVGPHGTRPMSESIDDLFQKAFSTDDEQADWLRGLWAVEHVKELDQKETETALQLLICMSQGSDVYDIALTQARERGLVR